MIPFHFLPLTVTASTSQGGWADWWRHTTGHVLNMFFSSVVCVCVSSPRLDEHGHLKIYLPKKLLECLPKCSSLPKERHRWNTNEVRLPSLIPRRSPPSITLPTQPSARHIDLSALVFSFFSWDRQIPKQWQHSLRDVGSYCGASQRTLYPGLPNIHLALASRSVLAQSHTIQPFQ